MLLQKYHLNSLLILVLISLNAALCIRLYNQKSLLSNINDRLFEAEKYSEYYLASIEKQCKTLVDFSTTEIQHFLSDLSCRELLEENSFCALIPTYPCDVCLNKEIELLLSSLNDESKKFYLIVPDYRYRDIIAKVAGKPQVSVVTYPLKQGELFIPYQVDNLVYFYVSQMQITNIYFCNKDFEDYSIEYLSKHFK